MAGVTAERIIDISMSTTIVTLNFNNCDDTRIFLASVNRWASECHVVVVDNASEIGDVAEACALCPGITLIRSSENIGFGRGNNLGIRWALENTNSEFIMLLNNDTYIDVSTIDRLETYLASNPHIAGCSPRIVYAHDFDRIWYGGGELNWMRGGALSWNINKKYDGRIEPEEVTFVTGCAMMLRRSVLEKIGGFDPRYFLYVEDVELCARIGQHGGRLAYVPTAVLYHRAHGSIRNTDEPFVNPKSPDNPRLTFYLEHVVCNTLLVFSSYARGSERYVGAGYLLVKWLVQGVKYLWCGRFDALIAIKKGLCAFLKARKKRFVNELQ